MYKLAVRHWHCVACGDDLKTNFQLVHEFHEKFCPDQNEPSWDIPKMQLRTALIEEEWNEFRASLQFIMKTDDKVATADALTDLLYVIYGAGHAFGMDLDACFREVHRSNMSKLGEDGQPIHRADGKVLKGPNYSPPELERFIQ